MGKRCDGGDGGAKLMPLGSPSSYNQRKLEAYPLFQSLTPFQSHPSISALSHGFIPSSFSGSGYGIWLVSPLNSLE